MKSEELLTSALMKEVSVPSQRWAFLDVVSGVMLLHMIVGHVLQRTALWNDTEYWYSYVRTGLFFFMPYFYFKAGVFVSRRRGVKEWVSRDVRRLLVPMAVWTVVGSLVANVIELQGDEPRVWWKVWFGWPKEMVVCGSAHGGLHLWFLLSLFWVRLVYRLLPEGREWIAMAAAIGVSWLLWKMDVQLWLAGSSVFSGLVLLMMGAKCRGWIGVGDRRDDREGLIRSAALGIVQASLASALTGTNVVPYKAVEGIDVRQGRTRTAGESLRLRRLMGG